VLADGQAQPLVLGVQRKAQEEGVVVNKLLLGERHGLEFLGVQEGGLYMGVRTSVCSDSPGGGGEMGGCPCPKSGLYLSRHVQEVAN